MESKRGSRTRLVLKTLVALLAGAVASALLVTFTFIISIVRLGGDTGGFAETVGFYRNTSIITFLVSLMFTAPLAFIIGGPLLLLGIKLRWIRWWSTMLMGFLIGFIPAVLVDDQPTRYKDSLVIGLYGALGGLAFWLVWHFWVQRTPPAPTVPLPAEPAPAALPGEPEAESTQ